MPFSIVCNARARIASRLSLFLVLGALAACRAVDPPMATVPLRFDQGNALAIAIVNGRPLEVVVDTGGFGTLGIAPAHLDPLEVAFSGDALARRDVAGNTFQSRQFTVDTFQLGSLTVRKLRAFERVAATEGIAGGPPISVLGRGFFERYNVVVDYPEGELRLYPLGVNEPQCGANWIPASPNDDGHLVLPVHTDAGPLQAVIDSGATYSFLKASVAKERQLQVSRGVQDC